MFFYSKFSSNKPHKLLELRTKRGYIYTQNVMPDLIRHPIFMKAESKRTLSILDSGIKYRNDGTKNQVRI